MGIRPPSNNADDEPVSVEFGIAAVDAKLSTVDLSFPATASEIDDVLGDADIPYDAAGNSVTLSEALENVDHREFETSQSLLNALHPVFEDYRQRAGSSFITTVRSLLPF